MKAGRLLGATLAMLLVVAFLVGCGGGQPRSAWLGPSWLEIFLPPAPPGWTNSVLALTSCDSHWFATGAFVRDGADPRPAAWYSADGHTWSSMIVAPNTYYGERNLIYAAACEHDRLVAIGGKAGGAHGNPRISTWYTDADQRLVEVEARPYTLFGGEDAVNTTRIAAGPYGFILIGNRVSGAAAWLSPRGESFEIVEGAPGLAHGDGVTTYASDVVAADGGWLITGSRTSRGERDPAAWTSLDGRQWQPQPLPAGRGYEELQRVARSPTTSGQLVAVGPRGSRFGAWWRDEARVWHFVGEFGDVAGTVPGAALGLAAARSRFVSLVSDADTYQLWNSTDFGHSWVRLSLPIAGQVGPATNAVLASANGLTMLAIDDGMGSRLWSWMEPAVP